MDDRSILITSGNSIFVNSFGNRKELFRRVSDTDIIEGVRRQDDRILNWLYENFLPPVRHYVLKNSGSEPDVSDVFQEAVITLYRRISCNELNLTTDLKGYFFGIARNIWNSQLRLNRRNSQLDNEIPDNRDPDGLTDAVLEKIISRAISKLKPDARKILKLFAEGYSFEEIAVKMNLKNEAYARRKKYLSKEALMEIIKEDPEYRDYVDLRV